MLAFRCECTPSVIHRDDPCEMGLGHTVNASVPCSHRKRTPRVHTLEKGQSISATMHHAGTSVPAGRHHSRNGGSSLASLICFTLFQWHAPRRHIGPMANSFSCTAPYHTNCSPEPQDPCSINYFDLRYFEGTESLSVIICLPVKTDI